MGKELYPTLREQSAECEQARRVLPQTIKDFIDAGIPKIRTPVEFGDFGMGLDVASEVAMQIGRGCGASAWMSAQWPGHQFIIGMFPKQAQQEYWALSPDVLSSTAGAITKLDMRAIDGGLIINSQYRFSSGVDAADWLIVITPEKICLIPKSDFTIDDDWYVAGLRGTGSKGTIIKDAFVPDYRTIPTMDYMLGNTPAREYYPNNPFYKVPFPIWGGMMLTSPIIGMAQGVIDLFDKRVRVRKNLHTMRPATEQPGNQLRFAESTSEVDAARLILRDAYQRMKQRCSGENELTLHERARFRRDSTYAARLCIKAVDRLYESGDASAMYDSSHSQRLVRDVHAAALQTSITWDEPAM